MSEGPRTFINNLRTEERRYVTRQPEGRFSVITDGREVDVRAVHDVSASGIRLHIAATLGVPTRVELHYRHAPLDLKLNGITRWESSADDGSHGKTHMVGIDLLTPTVLINIL